MELNSDNFISRHCGQISQPWTIITNSNTLTVSFRSDEHNTGNGFLAVWTASSEPPTYTPTGCDNCIFPYVFNRRIFYTCTSIDGYQPWCPLPDQPPAPTDQGIHLTTLKSSCSDIDSSCPRTPQMSTNPNNQLGSCCKFYNLSNNLYLTYEIMFRLWHTKQRR